MILDFSNNVALFASIGFLIVAVIFFWYAFAMVYHFLRFGIGAKPKILAFIFFVGFFILFTIFVDAYSNVSWIDLLDRFKPSA
ncbi:MAG: hypothetical protein NTV62_01780 [Candidatus Gribaldobacteria bacterium]|nr:hypothetical protein [Candidatus Gribaldobacteria bacterium]